MIKEKTYNSAVMANQGEGRNDIVISITFEPGAITPFRTFVIEPGGLIAEVDEFLNTNIVEDASDMAMVKDVLRQRTEELERELSDCRAGINRIK